ncbi:toll/interleukin-1 receptor domain-containing protein [Niveispirillum sp. SYP-B3756]|uniref:toll/interleukin-1 receptor domain-containing protein n=1 Tax=Niveispirillum sp. SYP-B3756 TaxID=2662178 RepID=UPI0015648918|nr:toll/interleukin-1 receptor domain-containing protein [Niveispirillum sp. SYP-B3756]
MARIFISHSSRDNAEAAALKQWLGEQGFDLTFLDFDEDSGIPPAANWEQTLYREVERSQAMLLVLTPNWMASKWCFVEFAQARALGKKVFPILHTPTGEQLVGQDLQRIDLLGDRQGGLERLARELRTVSQLSSPDGFDLPKGVRPFPGLSPFAEEQAAVFYGRDLEIAAALEKLRACHTNGGPRLFFVLGPSGSGKSSFLRAGLLPRLRRDTGNWIVLRPIRPGAKPLDPLLDCLTHALTDDPAVVADWQRRLCGPDSATALYDLARQLRRHHGQPDASILVPLDQFEEVLTQTPAAERAAFLVLLSRMAAADSPFLPLATLRSDYLPGLQQEPALTVPYKPLLLDKMPLERIGDLVRKPARIAHLAVEEGLVTQLIQDAATSDALPLVASVLEELYDRRGDDASLTLAAYESLGERARGLTPVDNNIRRRAETALESAGRSIADREADEAALREAFITCLVRLTEAGGTFVRQPAQLADLPERARPLIEQLVAARLLVRRGQEDGGLGGKVEVAHESLFRVWPLLAGWLREETEFLLGRERLAIDLKEWQALPPARRPDGLLRGLFLDRARNWLHAHPGRFGEAERAFILASDLAERTDGARKRRMRRALTGALVAIALIFAGGAGVSYYYYRQAERTLAQATEAANTLVFDLAQKFKNRGLPNQLVRAILDRAITLQDTLAADNGDNKALLRSGGAALDERAQSLANFGDLAGALAAAEQSLEIARRLVTLEPENTQFLRDLAVSLHRVGELVGRRDPDQAGKLHAEGLGIFRWLVTLEPENTQFQRYLSLSLNRVGELVGRRDPDQAGKLFAEGLEIARRLVTLEPENTQFLRDLSISLERVGDLVGRRDPDQAGKLFAEGLEIRRRLVKLEPENTQFLRDLAVSLS